MVARTPERILGDLAQGKGKGAKMRSKLTANKERNWLLALTLHSFAKLDANTPLTGLEESIVKAYRANGFSEDQLKQEGRRLRQLPPSVQHDIFPHEFAELTDQTNYTLAKLKETAPKIVQGILNTPNVATVDVQAVHAGTAPASDFPMVSRKVMQAHGGAMLIATAPNTTSPNSRYTIKATQFRCNDETGTDFLGSDEPYWIFGSLGSGTAVTTRSRVFGDVDTGDTRPFNDNEGSIWGQNGQPQDFPEGEIGVLIQLWEHDNGNPERVRSTVAAAFAAAAGILGATGVAAWIGAVVAGVGAVVGWLIGFLDDDHIADQTFVFTRQVVEDRLKKAGQAFDMSRRFTDGDGDYSLTVRVSRVA
jgi:hypothetical protein